MIDIENEVFNYVWSKVQTRFPKVNMVSEYVESPASFPNLSLVEVENQVYRNTRTSSSMENHAQVVYELNVYSNKNEGRKSECKSIIAYVDELMQQLGFTRVMLNPVPNRRDATVYRMVARYRAMVSKNKMIYRR